MAFRILSFCGGGIRGLLSTGYLSRLYFQFPDIIGKTDMFAGTLTGADIISLLLAGMNPDEAYNFYINEAPKAFQNLSTDPDKPGYKVLDLLATQRVLHPLNRKLNNFKDKKLLITSFNVGKFEQPWTTELFTNFETNNNGEVGIIDAVVSSSCMQGMYGSHKGNVDGAFVNHDPTLAAIALAVSNGHRLDEISAVTFGTGFMSNWIASDTSEWGAHQWLNGDDNPANKLPKLLVNGTDCPILNAIMNGTSTTLTPQLSKMLLGNRYAYVDSTLDQVIAENDISPEALMYMRACVFNQDLSQAMSVLHSW